MQVTITQQIKGVIDASIPLLWLTTTEVAYFKQQIKVMYIRKKEVYYWDTISNSTDVAESIKYIQGISKLKDSVVIIEDFHQQIKDVAVARVLYNIKDTCIENKTTIVFISAELDLPPLLKGHIYQLRNNVATKEMLMQTLNQFMQKHDIKIESTNQEDITLKFPKDDIINAGIGLTLTEYTNALLLELQDAKFSKTINISHILEAKKQKLTNIGGLMPLNTDVRFKDLCGLERLKSFAKGMIASKKAKGVLLLGVPGSGKTAFANAVGNETNRITLSLDFSLLMGNRPGETEHNTQLALDTIDEMAPCILLVDELEKGLAGIDANTDDSSGKRQGSLFLKWLNDHTSEVFVIATSNNVDKLPSEYLRAERWDALFFIDLPDEQQQHELLKFYKYTYKIKDDEAIDVSRWTGAEIKAVCRIANAMNISLKEASVYINPISDGNVAKIRAIQNTGRRMCINANVEEVARILKVEDYK